MGKSEMTGERPKSVLFLSSVEQISPPKRIASFIPLADIPQPLSIIAIHGMESFHRYCTEIVDAFAAMELSIMSAMAVSNVYPI